MHPMSFSSLGLDTVELLVFKAEYSTVGGNNIHCSNSLSVFEKMNVQP